MAELTWLEARQRKYWTDILKLLLGGKIVKICIQEANDYMYEEMYGLLVEMPNGQLRRIMFLSDDEGNGAGRFEVEFLEN